MRIFSQFRNAQKHIYYLIIKIHNLDAAAMILLKVFSILLRLKLWLEYL